MGIKEQNKIDYDDVITDTQRAAWNDHQKVMGKQEQRIVVALTDNKGGLTNFEICKIIGRAPHSVSGSLTRLRERGMIEDTDQRKLNPDSGKSQIVWRLGTPRVSPTEQTTFPL